MHDVVADITIFALLSLGGGEIILIVALCTVLLGAKKLPGLARRLRQGIREFRKALWQVLWEVRNAIDGGTHDAGKSVGGIYGKPAAEALTCDNQTAELYDPAVFQDEGRAHEGRKRSWSFGRLWRWIRKFFNHG